MRKITLQFVLFNQSKFNIEHLVKAMKKLPVILIAADVEDMKVIDSHISVNKNE